MATHSSVLAWRIPGTGEPGGLPSMGPHGVGHDWSDLAAAAAGSLKVGTCLCCCCLAAKTCLTLCGLMDYSPPGSSVPGILQARILECVAIPFFMGSFRPRVQTWVSCIAGGFFTSLCPLTSYVVLGKYLISLRLQSLTHKVHLIVIGLSLQGCCKNWMRWPI